MSLAPGIPVQLRLNKVSSWQGKRIKISQKGPARTLHQLVRCGIEKGNAGDLLGSAIGVPQ
jgi:hypothetical protein